MLTMLPEIISEVPFTNPVICVNNDPDSTRGKNILLIYNPDISKFAENLLHKHFPSEYKVFWMS